MANQQFENEDRMGKRPSLAETMRQVAVAPAQQPAPPVVLSVVSETPRPVETVEVEATDRKPYFAATRVGKKKVTVGLSHTAHKQLKSLAIEHDTKAEALLAEAIRDLFTKYGKAAID